MEIIVMNVDRDTKIQKRITQCVQQNICVECGQEVIYKRGLGRKCSSRFENRCRKLPTKTAKRRYMQERMQNGTLLGSQEIRDIKTELCDPAYRTAMKEVG